MTPQDAKAFIAKHPKAVSFVKPSHLEELSPLVEVHVEAILVRKDEFHDLAGSYSPKKETLDKFAQAAGVAYNTTNEATRKEGDGCYIGRSQAMIMGPDGKYQAGDVCEYEFDVDVRLEEAVLNGKPDWNNQVDGRPGRREYTDQEKALERLQFRKVARQRANTGARNRATLSVLGMQTGFKGLFGKGEPADSVRTFLFSRIIVNSKNEMVAKAMLAQITGNTAALFGPPSGQQVPAALAAPEVPDATPAQYEHVDDWDGPVEEDDREAFKRAIKAIMDGPNGSKIPPQGITTINSAFADPTTSLATWQELLTRTEAAISRAGGQK